MQFESKVTPNVIANDEVLKQSQNQTQKRSGNFKKRLPSLSRAIKARLLHSVRNDKPASLFVLRNTHHARRITTMGPTRNDKIGVFQSSQIRDDKGFTFLQVLIVVGIIAVLAGIALARFNDALTRAKLDKVEIEIEMMGRAIEQVEEDTGNYLDGLEQLDDTTSPDGFSPSWWGPYLSSLPANLEDPWDTNYAYFFWTTPPGGRKEFRMGNYPPGPPGKGWDMGEKKGWGDGSLPPGLWKKLGSEESLSDKGFFVLSAGPDKTIATDDDIEYGKY